MNNSIKHIITNVEFGHTMNTFPKIVDYVAEFYKLDKETVNDQLLNGVKSFLRMIGVKGSEQDLNRDIKLMMEMEPMTIYKNLEFIKTNIFEMIYKYIMDHKNSDLKLKQHIFERLTSLENK